MRRSLVFRPSAEGKTNKQIAGQLHATGSDVARAVAAITTKINARKAAR